jgi:hypothetical protein
VGAQSQSDLSIYQFFYPIFPMYNSLTFYYSNFSLKDSPTDLSLLLNVPGQIQTNQEWLKVEHAQHQEWISTLHLLL